MSDYENSFLLWVTSGWCLNLFVMDESTRHDSSCITEILAQTLEMVNEIAMSRQVPMPGTVLICSDNTVRESKNQFVLRYLCNLLSKYHVRVTGLLNLRKSHTHDLLDQLWGILARRVASCDRFQSPASVIKILESELQRPGLKGWIGLSTKICVMKLESVREWKEHFGCQQVLLSGGLLEDATGNHVFLLMLYRGQE